LTPAGIPVWFFDIELVFGLQEKRAKGMRFFPFVVSSDKQEDDKPDAKRQRGFLFFLF
jgi:hypothetical protein